jgi:DUF4097 and DUF4098 domain-containing protein YvlB
LAAFGQMRAQFSDPNAPGTVRVESLMGSVTVTGTSGNEVIVEVKGGEPQRKAGYAPPGMKRIGGGGGEVEMRERGNVIRIESIGKNQDLNIQVPMKTSLKIESAVNGSIMVDGVEGEIEAESVNGAIKLTNIAGSVVANTVNGKVECVLTRAFPDKPMALTTLNGSIDFTLPANLKATLRMRSDNGDIFSDFDLTVRADRAETKTRRGWKSEGTIVADLNGGGPEIRLQTMNGKIYVRKK